MSFLKIQNITSQSQYFAGGATHITSGRGINLAASAVGGFPDDNSTTLFNALQYVSQGLATLVQGPLVSTIAQPQPMPNSQAITLNTVVTTNTVTLGGVTFEFRPSAGTSTAPHVTVALGASDAAAAANLKAAINANATLIAAGYVATDIFNLGTHDQVLVITGTTLPAVTSTGGTITAATATAAVVPNARRFSIVDITVAAGQTALTVATGLTSISNFVVTVVTAAGAVKYFDGVLAKSGGSISLSGGTSAILAATDVVTIVAYGF